MRTTRGLAGITFIVAAGLVPATLVLADESGAPCIVQIPVYSPAGVLLEFTAKSVTPKSVQSDRRFDLLSRQIDGLSASVNGDRILFPSTRIVGGAMEVALQSPGGARIRTNVVMTDCRVRKSLVFGSSDLGFDVSGVGVKGHLSGCRFHGDWWVRTMPMFGDTDEARVSEGYVDSDGSFDLTLGGLGVRNLMVIGKGKQPVKTIAFDVTLGRNYDLGMIDLAGSCPTD